MGLHQGEEEVHSTSTNVPHGERGKQEEEEDVEKGTWDEATASDSDEETEEEVTLESLLGQLQEVIHENLKIYEKYKALSRTNKQLTLNLDELNDEHEKLKADHETLAKSYNDLLAKHEKLSHEHEQLNSSYKELEKLFNK